MTVKKVDCPYCSNDIEIYDDGKGDKIIEICIYCKNQVKIDKITEYVPVKMWGDK